MIIEKPEREEPWKVFLNWGVVVMFFSMPLLVLIIQIIALHWPEFLKKELPLVEFKYLYEFQRALAILVFGLAGLRTWETVKNGKQQRKQNENNN